MLFKANAVFLRALSLVAALQVVAGCLPNDGSAPPIEIRVWQVNGQVSFESILRDKSFSLIPSPVRLRVSTLAVKDSKGEVIWTIRSFHSDPRAVGEEVQYGVLPQGFEQMIPRDGPAPELTANSDYEVVVSWGVLGRTTKFTHKNPE